MAAKLTRANKVSVEMDRKTVRQLRVLFRNGLSGIGALANA